MNRLKTAAIAGAALAVAASALTMGAVHAQPTAVPAAPKQGSCYYYTAKELQKKSSPAPSVSCTKTHTAEVFKVAAWYPSRSPFTMSDDELWSAANRLCAASKSPAFNGTGLNYWAFFIPNREQWNSGARWIRCDALRSTSSSPLRLASWQGRVS